MAKLMLMLECPHHQCQQEMLLHTLLTKFATMRKVFVFDIDEKHDH